MSKSKWLNLLLWAVLIYLLAQRCVLNPPDKQFDYKSLEIVDLDGNSLDWESTNNKVIFLNFWASWCGPCMAEMPSINSLYQQNQSNNDILFLIVNTYGIDDAMAVQSKDKYQDLPFYYLKNSGELDIKAIPLTYLINKNGMIVKAHEGFGVWTTPWFKSRIKRMTNDGQ